MLADADLYSLFRNFSRFRQRVGQPGCRCRRHAVALERGDGVTRRGRGERVVVEADVSFRCAVHNIHLASYTIIFAVTRVYIPLAQLILSKYMV